jgi:hypothetical protein
VNSITPVMKWVITNPLGIGAGFLASAFVLWLGSFFAGVARDAGQQQDRNERLITYSGYYAAACVFSGGLGCVFFAVRFVRWAWYS